MHPAPQSPTRRPGATARPAARGALRLACAATLAAAIAGPAAAQTPAGSTPEAAMREITLSLTYLQRIALPETAQVLVTLYDPATGLARGDSFPTGGKQVPIGYVTGAPTAPVSVSAAIFAGTEPLWSSAQVEVPAGREALSLPPIVLAQAAPEGRSRAWTCGGETVTAGFAGEAARMEARGRIHDLFITRTASGAKFADAADPGIWAWSKGEALMVSLGGDQQLDCTPGAAPPQPAATPVFTARGNEPGWRVDIDGDTLRLRTQDGRDETVAAPAPEPIAGGRRYALPGGMVLTVTDGLCHDSMTGLPYPANATLLMGKDVLPGCAGDPASLLAGPEWVVEDIGGGGIIDSSHLTMAFEEGRVAGSAGCNRFFAEARLTGEGLSFGQAGSTMMACTDALMQQERRFLDTLATVTGFDITATGALVLTAGGQPAITARR